jgi:hypothetical protein
MICPVTMARTAVYQAKRAPTAPISIRYAAVPKRFQPNPKGSDRSGMMSWPWMRRKVR